VFRKANVASRCDPFGKSQYLNYFYRRLKATVIAVAFRQRIYKINETALATFKTFKIIYSY